MDNISVMKSVTGGKLRGDFDRNIEVVEEFISKERVEYCYRTLPRRVMAQRRLSGDVTPEKVRNAVEEIKMAVQTSSVVAGRTIREEK